MRNVYTKTLYDLRWPIASFSVALGVLSFFILYIYPSVAKAQADMFSGLAGQTVKAILGNNKLAGTVEGYLNVQMFAFQLLWLAIFLIIVTSAAVAGEDNAKTLGMLLARPVPRWLVLTEKALAAFTGMLVILGAMAGTAVLGALAAGVSVNYLKLAAAVFATLPYGIWLLGFGLCCSALFRSRMVAALIATGVVVGSYMFNSLTEFVPSMKTYNQFLPVYYYNWGEPLVRGFRLNNAITLVVAGIVFYFIAILAFQRREVLG